MTLPNKNRDDSWKAALQPLRPGLTPSPALVERMTALVAASASATVKARSRQRLVVALCAVTVIIAAVTGAAIFGPKVALANTLRTVASNLRRAPGVHYHVTFFRRGRKILSQEIWYQQNQWRLEGQTNGARLIQIKSNGRFWNYDPARRVAWYQTDKQPPLFTLPSEEQFQLQAQRALSGGKGEDLGTVTYQGRRLQRVAVPSPVQQSPWQAPVPGRTVFTIDRERMLPALTEQQVREGNAWVTVSRVELDLNHGVSPALFTIRDKNVRIYDINAYGAWAGSRFSRPLASKRFASRTIAIRDVQVNRDGDLFVLYTDGSTREQNRQVYPDSVKDHRGTVYAGTAGAVEPFMYHQNPRNSRGMTVGGEVMQGFCLVPLTPPPTRFAAPRRLTITIGFTERKGKKTFSGRARFTVPLRQTKTLLPTYAADLAALSLAGGDAKQYRETREGGRRMNYFNRGDWSGMIRTTDRAIRQGVFDVNTCLDRSNAFHELGRQQEARTALVAARAADENGFYAGQITEAEARLTKPR